MNLLKSVHSKISSTVKRITFFLFFIVPILACKDVESPTMPDPEFKKLVWADEFEIPGAPDDTKWNYDLGDGCPDVCGWGNNELSTHKDPKTLG
jgi:hypothetical protein